MEKGILKEVEENFRQIFNKIKDIYDFETAEIDFSRVDKTIKIVVENEDIYDDWLEIESLSLPKIEKIEEIEHADGPYLKVDYILETDFAILTRKIRIKSNGKVSIFNYINFKDKKNNCLLSIEITYDTYGNLIFNIEKNNLK
ncbi:MAG TPA: hypothetical protein EYH43_06225 [Persephonella sp.]|nr:hypothetical protein [Persephonella sp.]